MQSNNRYMAMAQKPIVMGQPPVQNAFATQAVMQRNMVLAGFNQKPAAPAKGGKGAKKVEEPVKEDKGIVGFVKKNKELCIVAGGVAAHYGYKYYQDKQNKDNTPPAQ